MITAETLKRWFTYHPPTPEQVLTYERTRTAAHAFAEVVVECTPSCPDQAVAVRLIREAVMTANAAIAELTTLRARRYSSDQKKGCLNFLYVKDAPNFPLHKGESSEHRKGWKQWLSRANHAT